MVSFQYQKKKNYMIINSNNDLVENKKKVLNIIIKLIKQ